VLANVLVLSYRPLYPDYDRAEPRPLHLSAIGDQDLAALVMMVEQLATVGVFSLLLARRQFQEAPAPSADGPQRHPLTV